METAEQEQLDESGSQDAAAAIDEAAHAPEPDHGRLAELARMERPDIEVMGDPTVESRDAVAANEGTPEDWERVTEWLLDDTAEVVTRKLMLQVGDPQAKPLPWIIRAIPIDVIKSAEREARAGSGNRQQRRGGTPSPADYDDLKANLRVVVEGTVKPDLQAIARERDIVDATVLLKRRFAYKPGIIAQLAGEVMALSGFDVEDVQAAGN